MRRQLSERMDEGTVPHDGEDTATRERSDIMFPFTGLNEPVLGSPPHLHSHPPFLALSNFSGNTIIDTHRDTTFGG